jgi:hypothetical protein
VAVGNGVAVGGRGEGTGDGGNGVAVSQPASYVGVGELDLLVPWGRPFSSLHVKPYQVSHAPNTAATTNPTMVNITPLRLGRGYKFWYIDHPPTEHSQGLISVERVLV